MNPETTDGTALRRFGESLQAFYPLILSVVCTPFILKFDVFWAGIALGVILIVLKKTWWTCIFGLLNGMAVVAMILACVAAWVVSNKNEANKTLLLTPDQPPIQAAMTIPPPTRSRSLATGEA